MLQKGHASALYKDKRTPPLYVASPSPPPYPTGEAPGANRDVPQHDRRPHDHVAAAHDAGGGLRARLARQGADGHDVGARGAGQ